MRQQSHHIKAVLCILGGVWMLAVACSESAPTPMPQATPAGLPWGKPHILGQAESLTAPASAPFDDTTMFVWAGADQQQSRLYAQSAEMPEPTILALKVTTPLDVITVPSSEGYFHLLWRDDVEGKPHLFYSLFNKEAVAVLDAYDLSEQPVYNFAVQRRDDGSVRVVYSAGWVAEPRLFVHDIDSKGRAQFPVALDRAGDFPDLFQDRYGQQWLFWQAEDGAVWSGRLEDTTLKEPEFVVARPVLAAGDSLISLSINEDLWYYYLFWQIVRADGTPETWYAVGNSATWSPAMRLTIPTLGDAAVDVGYNVGYVTDARRGADPVGWSRAIKGPSSFTLAIVVQTGDVLGMAYLHEGNVIGYQRLTPVGSMISSPTLIRGRSLVVTWAEVGTDAAQLYWLQSPP